jgi:hypothetical protein
MATLRQRKVSGMEKKVDAASTLATRLLQRRGVETRDEKQRLYWHTVRREQERKDAEAWDREQEG